MEESHGITKEELSLLLSNSSTEQQLNDSSTNQNSTTIEFLPRANRKRKKAPLITRFFK